MRGKCINHKDQFGMYTIDTNNMTIIKKIKTNALLKKLLADKSVETITYYDRLTIYFDAKNTQEDLTLFLKDNEKNKYHTEPLPHNDHFSHNPAS